MSVANEQTGEVGLKRGGFGSGGNQKTARLDGWAELPTGGSGGSPVTTGERGDGCAPGKGNPAREPHVLI